MILFLHDKAPTDRRNIHNCHRLQHQQICTQPLQSGQIFVCLSLANYHFLAGIPVADLLLIIQYHNINMFLLGILSFIMIFKILNFENIEFDDEFDEYSDTCDSSSDNE